MEFKSNFFCHNRNAVSAILNKIRQFLPFLLFINSLKIFVESSHKQKKCAPKVPFHSRAIKKSFVSFSAGELFSDHYVSTNFRSFLHFTQIAQLEKVGRILLSHISDSPTAHTAPETGKQKTIYRGEGDTNVQYF